MEPSTQQALGAALALALVYASLRTFMNIDRALRRLYPAAVLLGAVVYYVHLQRCEASATAAASRSRLLQLWSQWQMRAPVAEHVVGDVLLASALVYVVTTFVDVLRKARYVTRKMMLNEAGAMLIALAKKLPIVSDKYAAKMEEFQKDIDNSSKQHPSMDKFPKNYVLPEKGMKDADVVALLEEMAGDADKKWEDGMVSGAVYHGQRDHLAVLNKAYEFYSVSNPLHTTLWPAVRKFEAEVIQMTASLVNGGNRDVCGAISSGGTESIFLAAKTHRAWFRQEHNIQRPEIIACVTAHAAIDKACELMDIKLIKVPCDPITMKMDVNAVRWSITANTIMIYSSAPNYPNGIIDDIETLSQIAVANGVGLHVDCCLGGFIVPFARKLYPDRIPKFDFELPGVTSMSCDTHKYGYSGKGTSVVLYKNKHIRHYQYFTYSDWTGGLYMTPTLAGSRPGALIATAWAAMMRLGYEGYSSTADSILKTAQEIKQGLSKIDGIKVLGDPVAMVVSFVGVGFNAHLVGDAMTKKGWELNLLLHPCAVHISVTVLHVGKAAKFLRDIAECVDLVQSDPELQGKKFTAMYGMSESLPAGPVDDVLRMFGDANLRV